MNLLQLQMCICVCGIEPLVVFIDAVLPYGLQDMLLPLPDARLLNLPGVYVVAV